MMKSRLPLLLFGLVLHAPVWAAQTICNDNSGSGWPINDFSETTISIPYNFADDGLVIDVDVEVDISHTYIGDLSAFITSPEGTEISLFQRPRTTAPFDQDVGPYGCSRDNLDVRFDDSAGSRMENSGCTFSNPTYSGSYRPHNGAPNNLSAYSGQDPIGTWQFRFMDPVSQDTGRMNEACIHIENASLIFDQWVSTNASCSDTVDVLSVASGQNIYTCYVITNTGDEAFSLSSGDWSNNLGHDLSGLERTYNPGVTDTVVIGPQTAGASPYFQGVTLGTAEVTIRGATAVFPSTESITTDETSEVYVDTPPPATGNKDLYLYDNLDLSRVVPTSNQSDDDLLEGETKIWTLTPALQTNLEISNSATEVPVTLYLGETGSGNVRDIELEISGSISGTVAVGTTSLGLTGSYEEYVVNIPITGTRSLVSGESISLRIQNTTNGWGTRRLHVDPSNGSNEHSRITLPAETVINVDEIGVYSQSYATNPSATPVAGIEAGNTAYVRIEVSDPFGSFDITAADITLTDAASNVQVNAAAMTEVFDSSAATKIYEYVYNVPAFPNLGTWRADVTAYEGTEGLVSHDSYTDFAVFRPPNLSVLKSANVTSANPGDVITYTVAVTNSGSGVAQNVYLEDTLSPFTDLDTGSFSCTAGCPGSGVTLGTVNFTTGVDGDITVWDVMMSGDMNPSSSFTLQYQATVE
ncbi:conserved domain protein [gamma proteobacterium HTCC5015]|nr:conserved domain protein [gamma proteobacterium HTCC5015]